MKIVKTLTKKHTRDLWVDMDGYVWYWDSRQEHWTYIYPAVGGYRPISGEALDGDMQYGPFTRIHKAER